MIGDRSWFCGVMQKEGVKEMLKDLMKETEGDGCNPVVTTTKRRKRSARIQKRSTDEDVPSSFPIGSSSEFQGGIGNGELLGHISQASSFGGIGSGGILDQLGNSATPLE